MDEDRAVGGPYLRVCFDTFDTCWKILHDAGDRDDNVFSHVVDLVSAFVSGMIVSPRSVVTTGMDSL